MIETSTHLLEIKDLQVRFRNVHGEALAVDGVNLTVERGRRVGLVGESGSGKSVTALAVMGLLGSGGSVTSGSIHYRGESLTGLDEDSYRKLRGAEMAMIFQDPLTSLNPVITIEEQITEVLTAHTNRSRTDLRDRVIDLMTAVGIPNPASRLGNYPHEFSGGMRQRILIAIALALRPRLLIADEPTTALDVTIQAQVLRLLDNQVSELGSALLLITHDLGVVAGRTDVVNVMYAGRIVESAPTKEMFSQPLHPYTAALLTSAPRLSHPRKQPLPTSEADVPKLRLGAVGCPYAPRCDHAEPVCDDVTPALRGSEIQPDRTVACHFPLVALDSIADAGLQHESIGTRSTKGGEQ